MQDWKKVGKKLLFPPIWIIALLTVICTVVLVAIFINGWEMSPLAYVCYALAFYTLVSIKCRALSVTGNQSYLCRRKCSIGIYISDILVCNICGILCNHCNDELPISAIRDKESYWL